MQHPECAIRTNGSQALPKAHISRPAVWYVRRTARAGCREHRWYSGCNMPHWDRATRGVEVLVHAKREAARPPNEHPLAVLPIRVLDDLARRIVPEPAQDARAKSDRTDERISHRVRRFGEMIERQCREC
jgi:hypothetical protein